jgi:nicotinamide-nucleotide amidase
MNRVVLKKTAAFLSALLTTCSAVACGSTAGNTGKSDCTETTMTVETIVVEEKAAAGLDMNSVYDEVHGLYRQITETLIEKQMTVTTMESCTAGLIASLITDTDGSSAVMRGAFVTYSNETKIKQGVPEEVIEEFGVYSEETACAMAEACREAYDTNLGVGITGTLGRVDPGNSDSVSGEVYFAIADDSGVNGYKVVLEPQPDRFSTKLAAAKLVGQKLYEAIKNK